MIAKEDIKLPIAYNHIIQKTIYKILDSEYAAQLHDGGYEYKNKVFKMFNFSKMVIENKTISKNIITIHKGKVELTISSIDDIFIFNIISSLIKEKQLQFDEGKLIIDSIYSKKQLNKNRAAVLTTSPVVVTKSLSGRTTEFHNPKEREFLVSIKNNLLSKYKAFYGEEYMGELDVQILDKNKIRKKVDRYKNWIYEAYLGGFIIEGDKQVVELAYSCGLGSKNAQGFGAVETFKDLNNLDNYSRIFKNATVS
jgi:CRISPR-associated endoribonuclease Cas6